MDFSMLWDYNETKAAAAQPYGVLNSKYTFAEVSHCNRSFHIGLPFKLNLFPFIVFSRLVNLVF